MKANIIIDQETQKVKLILDWKVGKIGEQLTADEVENITRLVEQAMQNAGREAFKAWLMHDGVFRGDLFSGILSRKLRVSGVVTGIDCSVPDVFTKQRTCHGVQAISRQRLADRQRPGRGCVQSKPASRWAGTS